MEGSGHRVSRYRSFARALLLAPIAFVGVFVVVPTLVALRHGFDITEIATNAALRRGVVHLLAGGSLHAPHHHDRNTHCLAGLAT